MLLSTQNRPGTTIIAKERRPWTPMFVAMACVAYLLSVGTAGALIWSVSDRWWPATVLLFSPRWILALPLVVLVPFASVFHRRSLITLVASGVVLAIPVMGYRFSMDSATLERQPGTIRVVSYNIHRQQVDVEAFRRLLDSAAPDVVAIQDWTSKHEGLLFNDPGWFTQRDGELFVASRFPILRTRQLLSPPSEKPGFDVRYGAASAYELATPDGLITIVNLHLASPHEALSAMRSGDGSFPEQLAFNSRQRELEAARIADFVEGSGSATIVVGDFNTPRESPIFRQHFGGLVNAFSVRGKGFGVTHVSSASSVRIDHVLVTPGIDVRECWLGEAAGSPHRPVVADLWADRTATLRSASSEP